MPDARGWGRGPALAVGVLLATSLLVLPVRAAATAGELAADTIPTFDVVLMLGTDGTVRVRETITYDFDQAGEQGIVRRVPYRHGRRLYEVRDVRTSSSTGAPARAETVRLLRDVRISVGDDRRLVRGRQAYVIEYELAGALTPYPDRDELTWDAIGDAWSVPIGEAAVRVESPVPLRKVGCRAGRAPDTTGCLRDRDGPQAIDFTQRGLRPHEGMTIRVKLPKGAVTVPPPRYAGARWQAGWPGVLALVMAFGVLAVVARRPPGDTRAGRALLLAGGTLMIADAAVEVLTSGLWEFALGDPFVIGAALAVAGAAALRAGKDLPPDHATDIGL